jgi:hypothetical protein
MDVVLAVAVTDTAAQLTMTDAVTGKVLDSTAIDFTSVTDPRGELAATIRGTHESVRDGGHRLAETQIDWADAAQAGALRDDLAAAGLHGVSLAGGAAANGAGVPTMMASSVDAGVSAAEVTAVGNLAYSEVPDDTGGFAYGDGYSAPVPEHDDAILQTPMAPLNANAETDAPATAVRPRGLLVGSTIAGIAVVLIAATSVTLAIGVRPAARQIFAQEPDSPPMVFEPAIGSVPDTQGEAVVDIPPPPSSVDVINPESTGIVYGDSASTTPPEGVDINAAPGPTSLPIDVGALPPPPPPGPAGIPGQEVIAAAPPSPDMFAGVSVAQGVAQAVTNTVVPFLNQPVRPRPPDTNGEFTRVGDVEAPNSDGESPNSDVEVSDQRGADDGTSDGSGDGTVVSPDGSTPRDLPDRDLIPGPNDTSSRPDLSIPGDATKPEVPSVDLKPATPPVGTKPVTPWVQPKPETPSIGTKPEIPVIDTPPVVRDSPSVPAYDPPDPVVPAYDPPDPVVPAYDPPAPVVPVQPAAPVAPPEPVAPAIPKIPFLPQLPKIPFVPGFGGSGSAGSGSGSSDTGSSGSSDTGSSDSGSAPETTSPLLPSLPFLGGG